MVKKKGKRERKTTILSEKKEEASNVSEQQDKGWIHVICVQQHGRATDAHELPHSGLIKHRDYPLACTS